VNLQLLIVALVVPACAAYAAWKLMPGGARRALAQALLRGGRRWPAGLQRRIEQAARPATGCGCDGCDHKPAPAASQPRPITIHRRPSS
jgi:hypothetical protein